MVGLTKVYVNRKDGWSIIDGRASPASCAAGVFKVYRRRRAVPSLAVHQD